MLDDLIYSGIMEYSRLMLIFGDRGAYGTDVEKC
jgi:hypothetical protein